MDERVHATEARREGLGPSARRTVLEQVDRVGVDAVLGQAEVGHHAVEALLVALAQGKRCSPAREDPRDLGPEASRGAGDDDHPPFELRHERILTCRGHITIW